MEHFVRIWNLVTILSCTLVHSFPDEPSSYECPKPCICESPVEILCSGKNLNQLPDGLNADTTHLDLSLNNISSLSDTTFQGLRKLQELRLVGNFLTTLPNKLFRHLTSLQCLYLQGNKFSEISTNAFHRLFKLTELFLDANQIQKISNETFEGLMSLRLLHLDANKLRHIPSGALQYLHRLEVVDLSVNKIRRIEDFAFSNNTNLGSIGLHDNEISYIGDYAFEKLHVLTALYLQRNRLEHIPTSLIALREIEVLDLASNKIEFIPNNSFEKNKRLRLVKLTGNPILSVGENAFRGLPSLGELILSETRDMTVFPNLTGTTNLQILRLDRASISKVPSNLCQELQRLKVFDMHSNKITEVPNLQYCSSLKQLNLGNNMISSLDGAPFKNCTSLQDLTLSHNNIQSLPDTSFHGLRSLEYLDLAYNAIGNIDENAFEPLEFLADLNLAENKFSVLPTRGLQSLRKLKTFHNKNLQDPIDAEAFPNIHTLVLSYAYHCCSFINIGNSEDNDDVKIMENVTFMESSERETWKNDSSEINNPIDVANITNEVVIPDVQEGYDQYDYSFPSIMYEDDGIFPGNYDIYYPVVGVQMRPPIECDPMPGPFLPCDDLFGWWSLRCGVWIVFLLALFGNGTVLFVSVTARSKVSMDVPRFLICNLACADFFMGIYLGMLAILDASTLGEFRSYAIKWQTSPGCLVAGFLGIISSELSVFTLTVITCERFYAISNALQANKRLTLKQAAVVMAFGWTFSIVNASLPFFGISDYRKFAICLPFETSDKASLAYVCFLMLFNGTSFLVILACYFKMYCLIIGSNAWNSKDFRVAKRMAVLVFTDFLCWAPIIFFSVTAALGKDLIGLNEAKVLTIFVLPLNSCANPFLYAIFTKQFKRDCVKLCKRIEESSISRSLSNINSRRVSFGSSWRNSQLHSPFHTEKRSSISNSVSAGSSVAGVQNQAGSSSAFDNDNNRDRNDIRYMGASDYGNETDLLTKNTNIIGEKRTQRNLTVGTTGSDNHIVIHYDKIADIDKDSEYEIENNDESTRLLPVISDNTNLEEPETINTDKSNEGKPPNPNPNRKHEIHSKKMYTDHFKRRKVKNMEKNNSVGFKRIQHVASAPNVPIPEPEVLKLPTDSGDKASHINEWRKSSHLTYLWRNSLDLDGQMPKYKSNSLVELKTPQKSLDGSLCKRRSLSSRYEGYLLLKNSNRDSAYEDEEEMFEYNDCKSYSMDKCKSFILRKHLDNTEKAEIQHNIKRQSVNDCRDDPNLDEKNDFLVSSQLFTQLSPRKEICDKESGFSSET